ncbi:hypothetical protein FDP41_010517 [Naegleria fowleri]|uniref:Exonuclease domain-containing protein n=1 Tax=Naegleria fowleri TaxID=5763 RepID=A0A6A5C929_NAEFO|nr:uncharacterized protein FDP41_010517 [Naegleria fowleri]KAF0983452.1 hypothetical protein FDP41_010517 [Naegleria fowleri]CAG4715253.1 unnamed protein product [Naegleria fowleri]
MQQICNFIPEKCIIVAHNAVFDRTTFLQAYKFYKTQDRHFGFTDDLRELIFLDSISIFKERLKKKNINTDNTKLGILYENLFHKPIENQHTAKADVVAMIDIMNKLFNRKQSHEYHLRKHVQAKTNLKGSLIAFKNSKILSDKEVVSTLPNYMFK